MLELGFGMALLETNRLRLRRFTEADLPNLLELEGDAEVVKKTPTGIPQAPYQTRQRLKDWIVNEKERAPLGFWCAETREGDFVGWFMMVKLEGADPEFGGMLLRRQWAKGYATEAGKRLVEHVIFELGFSTILATVDAENSKAEKVLEKLGFQKAGARKAPNMPGIGERNLNLYLYWG
jgi:RimJ/RimL family protein N-acetyltransferase